MQRSAMHCTRASPLGESFLRAVDRYRVQQCASDTAYRAAYARQGTGVRGRKRAVAASHTTTIRTGGATAQRGNEQDSVHSILRPTCNKVQHAACSMRCSMQHATSSINPATSSAAKSALRRCGCRWLSLVGVGDAGFAYFGHRNGVTRWLPAFNWRSVIVEQQAPFSVYSEPYAFGPLAVTAFRVFGRSVIAVGSAQRQVFARSAHAPATAVALWRLLRIGRGGGGFAAGCVGSAMHGRRTHARTNERTRTGGSQWARASTSWRSSWC
jgi:hypothetical protein